MAPGTLLTPSLLEAVRRGEAILILGAWLRISINIPFLGVRRCID
jgi:hypothetical protein